MKKLIVLVIISLSVFGCSEDFLDRQPTTLKVVENFYKTPADAAQGLTSVYNALYLTFDATNPINLISEIASDNAAGGGGTNDATGLVQYDRFLPQSSDAVNQTIWQAYYTGIFRASTLIENIENVDWSSSDTTLKNQYICEARFLRAYFNFCLVRLFGEVPILYTAYKSGDPVKIGTTDEFFTFIAQDLKYAADRLPSTPSDYSGHVTKWAAESMLGRAFLFYTGRYSKTEIAGVVTKDEVTAYIDDVIENSGHDLVADYKSLWRVSAASAHVPYAGENNVESVFAVKFNYVGRSNQELGGSWWSRMIGPRSENHIPYGQGWGAMTVTPDLWSAYSSDDTVRRFASILSWSNEGITYSGVSDQRQYTGYNCKKYENLAVQYVNSAGDTVIGPTQVQLGASDWQWDNPEDYMEIRFADVLLMGAELHLTDNLGLAKTYFDRVRDRAFHNDPTHHVTWTGSFATDQMTIINERRLELALEGQRYWDLIRLCGTSFTPLVNAVNKDSNNPTDWSSLYVNGENAETVKGLFQIPPAEIRLMNHTLEQNEGYPAVN